MTTKHLHALNTFKPYAVFYRTGGQIEKFHFLNGWGASVANHSGSYGGDEGLYELAEINPNGHIDDDSVKGLQTCPAGSGKYYWQHTEVPCV